MIKKNNTLYWFLDFMFTLFNIKSVRCNTNVLSEWIQVFFLVDLGLTHIFWNLSMCSHAFALTYLHRVGTTIMLKEKSEVSEDFAC